MTYWPIAVAAVLILASRFLMEYLHGRKRAKLCRIIQAQEQQIEKLTSDMLFLMDERNRYKGALEALVPPPGVVYETRIVRDPPSIEDQIRKMIRNAGGY